MSEIILGIDVGITNIGTAIVTSSKWLLYNKLINTKEFKSTGSKLVVIHDSLTALIDQYSPTSVIYEMPVRLQGSNGPKLLAAVGIIEYLCALRKLPVTSKTATEIKKKVAGIGTADKHEVELGVRKALLNEEGSYHFSTDHEADAAAIALFPYL